MKSQALSRKNRLTKCDRAWSIILLLSIKLNKCHRWTVWLLLSDGSDWLLESESNFGWLQTLQKFCETIKERIVLLSVLNWNFKVHRLLLIHHAEQEIIGWNFLSSWNSESVNEFSDFHQSLKYWALSTQSCNRRPYATLEQINIRYFHLSTKLQKQKF